MRLEFNSEKKWDNPITFFGYLNELIKLICNTNIKEIALFFDALFFRDFFSSFSI
jgi:hypothetical protein